MSSLGAEGVIIVTVIIAHVRIMKERLTRTIIGPPSILLSIN